MKYLATCASMLIERFEHYIATSELVSGQPEPVKISISDSYDYDQAPRSCTLRSRSCSAT
jgi:hypothetical protein